MNICINTNALKHLSLREALHFIKKNIDISNIELSTDGKAHAYEYFSKPVTELVSIFNELEMTCVCLSGGWTDFVRNDVALMETQVQLARALKTNKIRFFYTNPRLPDDYDEDDFLRCAETIGKQAILYPDIQFMIENHEGYFGTPSNMYRLLERINLPNVGTVFDPGNYMVMPHGIEEQWDTFGLSLLRKYIKHVHVKDLDSNRTWCTVGEGVVNWRDITSFLNHEYKGYYSIEYLGARKEEREEIQREKNLVLSYQNFRKFGCNVQQ